MRGASGYSIKGLLPGIVAALSFHASSGFTYGYQACKVSLDGNGDLSLHRAMILFICSTLLLSSLHMIEILPKSHPRESLLASPEGPQLHTSITKKNIQQRGFASGHPPDY
jgi:hypothetical protein